MSTYSEVESLYEEMFGVKPELGLIDGGSYISALLDAIDEGKPIDPSRVQPEGDDVLY